MTVIFNKPIILPNIIVEHDYDAASVAGRRLEKEKEIGEWYKIEDVLDLWVESDFYTNYEVEI